MRPGELLDQIPDIDSFDVVGDDGAYDFKQCPAAISAHGATPLIPLCESAARWPANTSGARWQNDAVDEIARVGRREWKKGSSYHRRFLEESVMYRLKILTGNRLSARRADSHTIEAAIRVGVLNRMAVLARP